MPPVRDHEKPHSGQGTGEYVAQVGIVIGTDGRLDLCLKYREQGKSHQQNRQADAKVAYGLSQPSVGKNMIRIRFAQFQLFRSH